MNTKIIKNEKLPMINVDDNNNKRKKKIIEVITITMTKIFIYKKKII